MKLHEFIMRTRLLVSFCCVPILSVSATISQLPTKMEVLQQMALVNNYYMTNNAISSGTNDCVKYAYFTGCMEFYKVYQDQKLLDYMTLWAEKNKWALGVNADKHGADGQVCGQT